MSPSGGMRTFSERTCIMPEKVQNEVGILGQTRRALIRLPRGGKAGGVSAGKIDFELIRDRSKAPRRLDSPAGRHCPRPCPHPVPGITNEGDPTSTRLLWRPTDRGRARPSLVPQGLAIKTEGACGPRRILRPAVQRRRRRNEAGVIGHYQARPAWSRNPAAKGGSAPRVGRTGRSWSSPPRSPRAIAVGCCRRSRA